MNKWIWKLPVKLVISFWKPFSSNHEQTCRTSQFSGWLLKLFILVGLTSTCVFFIVSTTNLVGDVGGGVTGTIWVCEDSRCDDCLNEDTWLLWQLLLLDPDDCEINNLPFVEFFDDSACLLSSLFRLIFCNLLCISSIVSSIDGVGILSESKSESLKFDIFVGVTFVDCLHDLCILFG